MRRKYAALLFVLLSAFSVYSMTSHASGDTIMKIGGKDVTVRVSKCKEKHENGCHNGGYYSLSCSIDNSYYPCLGAIGGNCSVTCMKGSYACCGKSCECKKYPEKK